MSIGLSGRVKISDIGPRSVPEAVKSEMWIDEACIENSNCLRGNLVLSLGEIEGGALRIDSENPVGCSGPDPPPDIPISHRGVVLHGQCQFDANRDLMCGKVSVQMLIILVDDHEVSILELREYVFPRRLHGSIQRVCAGDQERKRIM